jgi:hypothetical protein
MALSIHSGEQNNRVKIGRYDAFLQGILLVGWHLSLSREFPADIEADLAVVVRVWHLHCWCENCVDKPYNK